MKKNIRTNDSKHSLTLYLFLLISPLYVKSQCLTNNSTETCVGGNGLITNNININGTDKYWWNTGTGSFSNINFGGGTLVICGGSLTITSGNLNGGTIIVMGGTLNLNMNTMLNNTFNIINYSTINVNNNLTLQGNPARIFNNSGSTLTVTGQTSINNTSSIINSSTFNTGNLIIQTDAGSVALCQNASAITTVNSNFHNNTLNSIQSPSGKSCIFLNNDITLNNNVSPHAALHVCDKPGGTNSGAANWGSSTVISNCPSCSFALPIELIYFNVLLHNRTVKIDWQTASEINNDFFSIERSEDGINWEIIQEVNGAGNSNTIINYSITDYYPNHGISYYRLKQTDFDGQFEYSDIKFVNVESADSNNIHIYPNPTNNIINIQGNIQELADIKIINKLGQDVTNLISISNKNQSTLIYDLSNLSVGIYFIKTKTSINIVFKK